MAKKSTKKKFSKKSAKSKKDNGASLGFEEKLWLAADKRRDIKAFLGEKDADTFHNDLQNGHKADSVLANPPSTLFSPKVAKP